MANKEVGIAQRLILTSFPGTDSFTSPPKEGGEKHLIIIERVNSKEKHLPLVGHDPVILSIIFFRSTSPPNSPMFIITTWSLKLWIMQLSTEKNLGTMPHVN